VQAGGLTWGGYLGKAAKFRYCDLPASPGRFAERFGAKQGITKRQASMRAFDNDYVADLSRAFSVRKAGNPAVGEQIVYQRMHLSFS
jgi:hypothetical protein